jgi:hypothetical protein
MLPHRSKTKFKSPVDIMSPLIIGTINVIGSSRTPPMYQGYEIWELSVAGACQNELLNKDISGSLRSRPTEMDAQPLGLAGRFGGNRIDEAGQTTETGQRSQELARSLANPRFAFTV